MDINIILVVFMKSSLTPKSITKENIHKLEGTNANLIWKLSLFSSFSLDKERWR